MGSPCREVHENKAQNQTPAVHSLSGHCPYYSFFVPIHWPPFAWSDDWQGETGGSDLNDPSTARPQHDPLVGVSGGNSRAKQIAWPSPTSVLNSYQYC